MLKNDTTDNKIKCIRDFINSENTEMNDILAFTIYLLIKGKHTFSEDFFNNDKVIFNDIMEFIDIKEAVGEDLKNFCEKLLGIYFACIKFCTVNEEIPVDKIPTNIKSVLLFLDFQTLSNLQKLYIPKENNIQYQDALDVLYALSSQLYMYVNLLSVDK